LADSERRESGLLTYRNLKLRIPTGLTASSRIIFVRAPKKTRASMPFWIKPSVALDEVNASKPCHRSISTAKILHDSFRAGSMTQASRIP